jgi:hypothetical protein
MAGGRQRFGTPAIKTGQEAPKRCRPPLSSQISSHKDAAASHAISFSRPTMLSTRVKL